MPFDLTRINLNTPIPQQGDITTRYQALIIAHNIRGIFHWMIALHIASPFDGRFLSSSESTTLIIGLVMIFNDALSTSSNKIIFPQ